MAIMRFLGKVITITSTGKIIVRTKFKPKIGCDVYDEKLNKIGVITDIMGPVHFPYVSIRLENDSISLDNLRNKRLYIKIKKKVRR